MDLSSAEAARLLRRSGKDRPALSLLLWLGSRGCVRLCLKKEGITVQKTAEADAAMTPAAKAFLDALFPHGSTECSLDAPGSLTEAVVEMCIRDSPRALRSG